MMREYFPEVDQSLPSQEHALQLAFIRTFPKNICISVDEDLEFPFYMMVRDVSLLKIHGSSVLKEMKEKPKWVCCQNLVISTVTGRPMAKFLVPISNEVMKKQSEVDYKRAKKMEELRLPQKKIEDKMPSAILVFLRGRNHNQKIGDRIVINNAYLETDEEKEQILYFYIRDRKKSVPGEKTQLEHIQKMSDEIYTLAKASILKRQLLVPISDKVKLHIDPKGRTCDILGPSEFLSLIVKTAEKEYVKHAQELAKAMRIPDNEIEISVKKASNIFLVYLRDKVVAKKYYGKLREFVDEERGIQSTL